MRFIGDVHGKFDQYAKIIKECDESIQIGDFGLGFPIWNPHKEKRISEDLNEAMSKGNHRFIRGNHDSPAVCAAHQGYIVDGTVEGDMMMIGGAFSIDADWRTPGVDFWEDEELTIPELNEMINVYEEVNPRVMITHDAPDAIVRQMFRFQEGYPSRSRDAYETMFTLHKPEKWIFGHWHITKTMNILGTEFICLGELDYIDL